MIFKRTRKFLSALGCGVLATAGKDNPEAGVKVEQGSLLGQAFAEGYRMDLLKCEAKLEDAADALRQIECITNSNEYVYKDEVWESLHKIAQDAWRITQK